MYIKFLLALSISVLVAQGNAQRPSPGPDFDHVIKLLNDLEKHITTEVRNIVDELRAALKNTEDHITDILNNLAAELKSTVASMLEKISELKDRAYELGIDISDCVDDSMNIISDLPEELLGVTAECLNSEYLDAENKINEAISEINNKIAVIDSYWTRIEECASRDYSQQEICVRELESEISRDSVDILDEIALIAEEALNYLNTLKTDLLICTSGKSSYLAEIGDAIVANVTACAINKFNPTSTVAPTTAAPTTAESTTVPSTTTEPTTMPPTTAVPTTPALTTAETNTIRPTTAAPTTTPPTTAAPTTVKPTTVSPTTPAFTTPETTTVRPTTAASTTAPTTVEPTTVSPSTASLTTDASSMVPSTTAEPTFPPTFTDETEITSTDGTTTKIPTI